MAIQSIDPRSGEIRRTYVALSDGEIEEKLSHAARAFGVWRQTTFTERARPMFRLAELLEAEHASLGRLMSEEMGKTLVAARAEAMKCARVCRYYAEHAESMLANEAIATEARSSYLRFAPLGPVLAIMPWNFPFWQAFRFIAPTLMAGNVGLLKHASNVPECATTIEDLLRRAGFPAGVFQTLLIGANAVERVLCDDRVAAATLTGSNAAGAAVAMAAGKVIKPTLLELGGSDAFIVMPSADLEKAVSVGVASRILNNGQSCINAKRFIIHSDVYDAFEQQLVAAFERLRVGDPLQPDTDVGPLALSGLRDEVVAQVQRSVQLGARCLTGATRLEQAGWWFRPGVLAEIPEAAPVVHEEVFGPVALLWRVRDVDAAIARANASIFGLGSSVWTEDPDEQRRFIDALEVGQVFVNAMVASDPRLPFGGVKQSGYGRELGVSGIRAFVNQKTVYVSEPSRI